MLALAEAVRTVYPETVELRHELHAHPEIRFEEVWTSGRIVQFLESHGIPCTTGHAKGTGVVAEIKGKGPHTVALRADMDALEVQEETGLPYASTIPNRMHACGHDGHSAALCGVGRLLKQLQGELPGTVRLIFQPAEEIAAGGRYIVEEGLLDGCDAAFGLHGWPALEVGHVASRPGYMMAGAQDFRIEVTGRGCHGADPASGVDPVVVAAHITTALQAAVSRETNPWDARVVTVTQIHAGHNTNVIPDTAVLEGTLRSVEAEGLRTLNESVARIAQGVAQAYRAEAAAAFGANPYPPLCNDPAIVAFAADTVRGVLGPDRWIELPTPYMVAEDFAFYLQRVPGAFLYVGVNPDPSTPYPQLHNCRYNFTDEALEPAMRILAELAWRFLETGGAAEEAGV